jgi:predicted pyridoxine 5'-phosphate oxidase superfamily flavin-nucleotide-binding protein
MKKQIQHALEHADSWALATTGPEGLNVIPVSVVGAYGEEIYLYDFFMQKTACNIKANPIVALSCWKGFSGIQIKGEASYETDGPAFEGAVIKMKDAFPDRKLKAVIRIKLKEAYDISPGASPENLIRK